MLLFCFVFLASSSRPLATVLVLSLETGLRSIRLQYSDRYISCVPCLSIMYQPLTCFCVPLPLFVYFQVINGLWYFLDHVQDLSGGFLCPLSLYASSRLQTPAIRLTLSLPADSQLLVSHVQSSALSIKDIVIVYLYRPVLYHHY